MIPTRQGLARLQAKVARLEKTEADRRRYEQQRTVLSRLGQRLAAVTSEHDLMRVACEETNALFRWDSFFLAHRTSEQEDTRIVCFVDTVNRRKKFFPGGTVPPENFSKLMHQVLRGKRLLINRSAASAPPVLKRVASRRASASLVYAPVRCARRVIGFLTVQSYTPERYQKPDLHLLQQVADIVAPALERVYAETALRKAHEELELRVRQRTAELRAANVRLRRETRQRESALEAMRDSEARFRAVTENSLSGVYIFGGNRFLYVNSAFAEMLGYTCEEILSMKDPYRLVHPDDRSMAAEQVRRRLSGEIERAQYRFRGLRKSGEIIHCEALGRIIEHQGKPVIIGNILDITETVRAEKALRKSEKALRKLTAEMGRRLESERARIARELHDHLGQVLTALNMNLAWMDKRTLGLDREVNARVSESIGYVTQMTTMIRSLCKSLHPVVLDHQGLIEALRSQVADFEQYSQIRCEFSVRPADLEVSKPVAIAVYRIIQEALTNVARHSGASRSYVSIRQNEEALTIAVRDDGRGAPPIRLSGSRSLGILGMRERAAAAGGTFHIENAGGGGIRIRAELPLRPPERRRPADSPERTRRSKPVRLK